MYDECAMCSVDAQKEGVLGFVDGCWEHQNNPE